MTPDGAGAVLTLVCGRAFGCNSGNGRDRVCGYCPIVPTKLSAFTPVPAAEAMKSYVPPCEIGNWATWTASR